MVLQVYPSAPAADSEGCVEELEDRTRLFIQGLFSKPSDLSCMTECHYTEKGVTKEVNKLLFSLAFLQCPQCWTRQKTKITRFAKGCL